ncbi:hypothetical protein ABZS88_12945 [Streptomyces sp. NPDC005480]|uniref:hypothetical protein n=1 Tax=Streptomyces sp. NPDC005480 TaxID=3154880 RepID=UPI0033B2CCCA
MSPALQPATGSTGRPFGRGDRIERIGARDVEFSGALQVGRGLGMRGDPAEQCVVREGGGVEGCGGPGREGMSGEDAADGVQGNGALAIVFEISQDSVGGTVGEKAEQEAGAVRILVAGREGDG